MPSAACEVLGIMANLPIYDRSGAEVGRYEIEPADLAPKISKQLLHDAVVMYQANLRQGTFRTKARGEVAGSTRKLYRQKGTGNARVGPRRTGKRVGGGHTHAKRPRDFSYRLPRKALRAAVRMAVAAKLRDDQLVIIDQLQFGEPSTKAMAAVLKTLPMGGQSTLVVTPERDVNAWKSARNIANTWLLPVQELNAYMILRPRRLLITKEALDALRDRAKAAQPAAATA